MQGTPLRSRVSPRLFAFFSAARCLARPPGGSSSSQQRRQGRQGNEGDLVAAHPRSGRRVVSLRRSRSEGVFAVVDGFAEGSGSEGN